MGISEEAAKGIEVDRARTPGLSNQGQLPASVRSRADCGRLPGGRLVSFLHAGGAGANHPGAPGEWQDCFGIRVC